MHGVQNIVQLFFKAGILFCRLSGGHLGGVLGTPLRGGESEPSGGDMVGDESLPSTSPKESVTVYP